MCPSQHTKRSVVDEQNDQRLFSGRLTQLCALAIWQHDPDTSFWSIIRQYCLSREGIFNQSIHTWLALNANVYIDSMISHPSGCWAAQVAGKQVELMLAEE